MEFLDPTSWSWDTLLDATMENAADLGSETLKGGVEYAMVQVKAVWTKFGWRKAETTYRQNLRRTLSTTKVLGNPKPIEITRIYTDVYVHDRPSALRQFSSDSIEKQESLLNHLRSQERFDAIDIVRQGEDLYILGRPGSGKTTFLKYLAIQSCKEDAKRVPIFVSLKEWSDSNSALLDYIASEFDICGFPKSEPFVRALLKSGRAIILLDGLDEVGELYSKRSRAIREIVNFTQKYHSCQFCLTCRTAATDYSFEHFKYLEIADFTEEQQQQFFRQWYQHDPKILQRFEEGWKDTYHEGLRELGRTPLLLTLLCLSFDETLNFPSRHVDLYKEALDALLRKWDSSRLVVRDDFYKKLSHTRREHLIEELAASFYFESKVAFRRKELERAILRYLSGLPDKEKSTDSDAYTVIRQIEAQHGIIVERAIGIYSFSHLTVQEYLTASHIVKNQYGNTFDELARLGLQDPKWREVVLFTAGLLPSADRLLTTMANRLDAMLGEDPSVLQFLAFHLCEALISERPPKSRRKIWLGEYDAVALRQAILAKLARTRHPPLTTAETKKVVEHILWMQEFLRRREEKYDFGLTSKIIRMCSNTITVTPSRTPAMLGGYFAKPDDFIEYLYGCRMLVECLEVSVVKDRSNYLSRIMSISDRALENLAEGLEADGVLKVD